MTESTNLQHAKHPYHLVDPSPWPLIGSISVGMTAFGAVLYFHNDIWWVLAIGLGLVVFTMFSWWRDVIQEATKGGHHNEIVQMGLRYGMALFIASEVLFFASFFWAYFAAAFYPSEAIGGVWPPASIQTFDPFDLPLLNTLILLMSGVTVTWAHHALREGDRQGTLAGLALTVLLGVTFTAVQAIEYSHAAFSFGENVYSSTFFMATGFHGFHVIVGTIFLAVCFFRARAGHFTPTHHVGFEAAAWYWHFVDVVWLFLFVFVYVYGAGAPAAHG